MENPEEATPSRHALAQKRILRARELAMGFLGWQAVDNAFDYLLYPAVILWIGPLWGGLVMAMLSLVFCLGLIRLYDRLGRDWLGLEYLKGIKLYHGRTRWKRCLGWLLNRGNIPAFIVLSVKYDPFITTAYLRREAFNGMARRDWVIFVSSWIIGNVTWTLLVFGGLTVTHAGWEWLWTFGEKR